MCGQPGVIWLPQCGVNQYFIIGGGGDGQLAVVIFGDCAGDGQPDAKPAYICRAVRPVEAVGNASALRAGA